METPTEFNAIRFHNVGISTEGIALYDQQHKMVFITKNEIQKITLKHGFQSERPMVEAVFGFALIVTGLYFIANFILEVIIHRIIYTDEILSLILLPLGVWFIVDGFRKRLYFEVSLDKDKRKFPLGKNPDKSELQKFIRLASQLGYIIDASILDETI